MPRYCFFSNNRKITIETYVARRKNLTQLSTNGCGWFRIFGVVHAFRPGNGQPARTGLNWYKPSERTQLTEVCRQAASGFVRCAVNVVLLRCDHFAHSRLVLLELLHEEHRLQERKAWNARGCHSRWVGGTLYFLAGPFRRFYCWTIYVTEIFWSFVSQLY